MKGRCQLFAPFYFETKTTLETQVKSQVKVIRFFTTWREIFFFLGFFSSGSETQSCIKYVAKTNSGAPKSDSKVAKTNSDHAVEHGPSENEPGYLSKLLNSPSQARYYLQNFVIKDSSIPKI